MPPGNAEASIVRFVLIVSVLASVMVAPDRFVAKVITAPLMASAMAARRVPGPLSAILATTNWPKGGAKLLQDAPFCSVPVFPLPEASLAVVPLP